MSGRGETEDYDPARFLREQLFQYAEDMRQLMSDHADLGWRYHLLEQAYLSLGGSRTAIDRLAECVYDLYFVTDLEGVVRHASRRALARFDPAPVLGAALPALLENQADTESPRCHGHLPYCLNCCVTACRWRVLQSPVPAPGWVHWFIRDLPGRLPGTTPAPSPEALLVFDADGGILAANAVLLAITGYTTTELVGQSLAVLRGEFGPSLVEADIWQQLQTSGHWHGAIYTRLKNGDMRRDWVVLNAAIDATRRIMTCLAVFSDLLPLRDTEKQLVYLAHHDILTGLPNRLLFAERLEQALRQARRHAQRGAVIFIDLDGFKPVNDTHGHATGDGVLRQVAQRLVAALRESDTVARLGGDEFAILAGGLNSDQAVATLGRKLLEVIQTPIVLGELRLVVGASIGIALFPDHGDQADRVLDHADSAMYSAKRSGGNTYWLHSPSC